MSLDISGEGKYLGINAGVTLRRNPLGHSALFSLKKLSRALATEESHPFMVFIIRGIFEGCCLHL